jgi:hypothetical protein
MDNTAVEVFLGDTLEGGAERHVLERLRHDLAQSSVPAVIYANFFAVGKKMRQVDLLVVTPFRCAQVELKNLDLSKPVVGRVNGRWRQRLDADRERVLERNYFTQALEATYAVSDVMRRVAGRGEAPEDGPFYRHIDTLLCLYPHPAAGSSIDRHDRVKVVDYDALLDRLATIGPRPPWDDSHWQAFTRELGVYRDQPESAAEQTRRQNAETVADYATRLTSTVDRDLPAFVATSAEVDDEVADAALPVVVAAARSGRTVTLLGQSGTGKSHTARHALLQLAAEGHLPVWLRCREHVGGRFGDLLGRATAPFSTLKPWRLMHMARDVGAVPVLILDGLNECEPRLRSELMEQVAALRLRVSAGMIITTTVPVPTTEPDCLQVVLRLPNALERSAVMASYEVPEALVPDAFRTPYELALAASCADDLGPTASTTDLFDTYVRRQAGTMAVRSALRTLAGEMDQQLRSSLTVAEAIQWLERSDRPLAPESIDTVFASPLLDVRQGRLSFAHEQLARFLAADKLVADAPDVPTLARWLLDPRHADLLAVAVGLERTEDRAHELLLALADVTLLSAALEGDFGSRMATRVHADVSGALIEARAANQAATFTTATEGTDLGSWDISASRTNVEAALLTVAGVALSGGLFVPEIAVLLDVTDERCATEVRRLREAGNVAPITEIVSATYAGGWSKSEAANCLPASLVLHALHTDFRRRFECSSTRSLAAELLSSSARPARWGRLFTALLLTNARSDEDAQLLPRLVRQAWAANGYHLRLEALTTAERCGRVVPVAVRAELAEVLSSIKPPSHWGLSSTLVEALAACDAMEPINSLESIREDIAAVLAAPDEPAAWAAASGIFYAQFEPEDILGPFAEAVSELDDAAALRLYTMAARDGAPTFSREWLLREVADRAAIADEAATGVLREAASTVPTGWQAHYAVRAHVEGLRGWAVLSDQLPDAQPAEGIVARAWRLVDQFVFAVFRDEREGGQQEAAGWGELLDLCAPAAVDVLYRLCSADAAMYRAGAVRVHGELVERFPVQVRQLMEWGLANRDSVMSQFQDFDEHARSKYVVDVLAVVGDQETISMLQHYVLDPELGSAAVEAVRRLERRRPD